MKKLFLSSLMLFSITAFSQIDMGKTSKPDSKTQGLFAKGGTLKLASLDCYNFKDLVIAFDIDDSFFSYDRITVTLKRAQSENESNFTYAYSFTKADFARRFKGKKYAFLSLFPEEALDSKSVMDFRRVTLQMVGSKKEMENSKMFIVV